MTSNPREHQGLVETMGKQLIVSHGLAPVKQLSLVFYGYTSSKVMLNIQQPLCQAGEGLKSRRARRPSLTHDFKINSFTGVQVTLHSPWAKVMQLRSIQYTVTSLFIVRFCLSTVLYLRNKVKNGNEEFTTIFGVRDVEVYLHSIFQM